jgi:ABC-2 type transport system ATP-binding protein
MLEITDLAKRYGAVTALDGATFSVRPGRLVGFLGPNGAGKTTTMRCVFGLARPDRGTITWQGRPIDRIHRLRFGYMPEQRGLYPRMKVADQLVYFAEQHGLGSAAAKAATACWLGGHRQPHGAEPTLPARRHGDLQRVQLGAALVHDPELLALAEPFGGLDPLGIATMTEILRERAAAGVAVVFSSHQLDLVEDVCEDVVIINRGRIAAAGAIDDLRAASSRRHLEVEVAGNANAWLDVRGDREVVERRGDFARLLVASDVDLAAVLGAAAAAGPVRRFAFQPPTLSELFMEAVAA